MHCLAVLTILICALCGSNAKIEFYFFSREHPIEKISLSNANLDLLNASSPLKFIVHGWGENSERLYYRQMTDAYLIRGEYNVIQVDWKELAAQLYIAARINTKKAGAVVGKFILKLNKTGIPLDNIHIIGHSLGAHVSGFAGKTVYKESGQKVHRITALDAAGPGFENTPAVVRLSDQDANMVDATHTDSKYNGFERSIGTVDFYANGGHRPQPGCEPFNPELYKMDPALIAFCSHTRSYHYFIEAINTNSIIATKCKSYKEFLAGQCDNYEKVVYGEDTPFYTRGVFYFRTRETKPYAISKQ